MVMLLYALFNSVIIILLKLINRNSGNTLHCAYKNCEKPRSDVINVHVVAHTHDDVGWLKTVDQYYYGLENGIQMASVRNIITSVIYNLEENPKRRFTYVEMAFFTRWWKEQSETTQNLVKRLVEKGQLQFANGGWVMNDEATVHYISIIDQMSMGLDFLNQTFGECGSPTVGWQIDPFGHSIEMVNLFKQFGFDGWFFGRMDRTEQNYRINNNSMEFMQRTHEILDENKEQNGYLFTNVLYDMYQVHSPFCFDAQCTDDYVVEDKESAENNLNYLVDSFIKIIEYQITSYSTRNVLIIFGGDFFFNNAYINFLNMDRIIAEINRIYSSKYFVFYSTPSCYLYAVNYFNPKLEVRSGDFFPYNNDPKRTWSGYFTSRPTVKYFTRYCNNIFQVCKQIYVLSRLNNLNLSRLVKLMADQMGVMQHHDAITGTEKQAVANDYMRQLTVALTGCESVIRAGLNTLMETKDNLKLCPLLNISVCNYTTKLNATNDKLTFVIYNSLGFSIRKWMRIPVIWNENMLLYYHIKNMETKEILLSQMNELPSRYLKMFNRNNFSHQATHELYFRAEINAMSAVEFQLSLDTSYNEAFEFISNFCNILPGSVLDKLKSQLSFYSKEKEKVFIMENSQFLLEFQEGLLVRIYNKLEKLSVQVTQSLRFYNSFQEGDIYLSGAYIFKPVEYITSEINASPSLNFVHGLLVKEVHQKFSSWASLVIRIYEESDLIESEWTVGPIPQDGFGKDVVVNFQFQDQFQCNGTYYIDSNGRQLVKRTYSSEWIGNSIFPMDSSAVIIDDNQQSAFLIHTDRAQGAGCTTNNSFDIMVHRRIYSDDSLGVGEPLNEKGSDGKGLIAKGYHYFTITSKSNAFNRRRKDSLLIFNSPLILFANNNQNNNKNHKTSFTSLNTSLPKNIHILSLENHYNLNEEIDYVILRVENIGLNPNFLHLLRLFNNLKISRLEELNLSANTLFDKTKRLKWKVPEVFYDRYSKSDLILIDAESIRTFRIFFK